MGQAVTFIKDKFEQTGKDLVTAAFILTHVDPEEIISEMGLHVLGLPQDSDVLDLLKGFYGEDPRKV